MAVMVLMAVCLLAAAWAGTMLARKTKYPYQGREYVNREILKCAWKLHMPELMYIEETGKESFEKWLINQMELLFPIGYMANGEEEKTLAVEDEDTYRLILKKQAEDENEVLEDGTVKNNKEKTEKTQTAKISEKKLKNYAYLRSHFYTVDQTTKTDAKELDAGKLLKKNMKIRKDGSKPKILIYHTHSQEAFKDSKAGDKKTSIVGMGDILTKELNDTYRIPTMHHEGVYDLIGGKMDRSRAYQLAEVKVRKILKKYPSIEVVIDLHRDGVGNNTHLVTSIDGKKTGQIMFFNGLSRTKKNGDIAYLKNPYIQDNLAFSMQMQLAAAKKYPGFTRRIYLKNYRYNMHLMPKYLLIEAGAQTNTVKEMQRSMKVLADLLDAVVDP
ncbi:stage II sporulation protein P [Dorea sp. OM07-5]|uniref:stage II sporulation protein P n=1 Tax=Dorea sp. OM07-5 TaxID=2293100 RepID=UPI001FAAF24B|nr:stage II sporulation protein P [Dorea sp. OM07-5]